MFVILLGSFDFSADEYAAPLALCLNLHRMLVRRFKLMRSISIQNVRLLPVKGNLVLD